MQTRSSTGEQDAPAGHEVDDRDDLGRQLRGMWGAVAGRWAEHADYVDARAASLTEAMLKLAALRPGERVLELACGPGGLGLAAAELVGPDGEAVLSDFASEMTAIASARAAARGLNNVSTRELDLEAIDEPDGSYDIVLCREGLMFARDPARAAREIHRVLTPGGRVALAVWGPRERNPWLGLVFEAVSAQLRKPVPPPGIPGPFSLDDPDEFAMLLSEAGLEEVAVDQVSVPVRAGTFEEWWARTSALAGPLAKMLESLPEEPVEAIRARLREAVRPYDTPAGLEFPGVTLVAAGRRV
jgi:SAM-dependent methyltransferase